MNILLISLCVDCVLCGLRLLSKLRKIIFKEMNSLPKFYLKSLSSLTLIFKSGLRAIKTATISGYQWRTTCVKHCVQQRIKTTVLDFKEVVI